MSGWYCSSPSSASLHRTGVSMLSGSCATYPHTRLARPAARSRSSSSAILTYQGAPFQYPGSTKSGWGQRSWGMTTSAAALGTVTSASPGARSPTAAAPRSSPN